MAAEPGSPEHSRAFQALVDGPADLTGLLAYALYKQSLREMALEGRVITPPGLRSPTPTERNAYRGDAQSRLTALAEQATLAAEATIISRAVGNALDDSETNLTGVIISAKSEIQDTIGRRTSFTSALAVNLIAWLVSLALTVLIVSAYYLPNWQADAIRAMRAANPPATHP